MPWSEQDILKWYKRGLVAAALALIAGLAWLDTAPSGRLRIAHEFNETSAFVSEVVPVQRTAVDQQGVLVTSEPVYVTVRYPRPFRKAGFSVEFENPYNLLMEMGAQNQPGESFELVGINHPGLNAIMGLQAWHEVAQAGAASVWQQQTAAKQYESLDQLWAELPDQERTAYYGTAWEQPYLPDFKRQQQPQRQIIPVPLKGSHSFYAATDQDTLSISLEAYDINKHEGPDDVLVQLLDWRGQLIAEQKLSDDGNTTEDGRLSSARALDVRHTGLSGAGVYQIVVRTTNDVLLKNIQVQAPYLVAKGSLYIAGGPEYRAAFGDDVSGPLHLVTNARRLVATTNHIESRQSIHIGQESLVVQEPFEFHEYTLPDTRRFLLSQGYAVSLEKGNVRVSGRGVFALSASAYFAPTPWYFDETVDAGVLELSTIVTEYQRPQDLGDGVYHQQFYVDLTTAYAPDKSVRLQLAVPELEAGQHVRLRRLDSLLETEPVTVSNFTQKLGNFIEREF